MGRCGFRFASLGNHDRILTDSPAAEVLRSHRSTAWKMPAARYTFIAGPLQLFAIDTNLLTRAHLDWLQRELTRSTARWKVVYGHHPIYSYGFHGEQAGVRDKLLPILRRRADLYLAGHDHDLQHLTPEDGVHFVIAGGGGAPPRPVSTGPRTVFAASRNGFAVIDGSDRKLAVTLFDGELRPLHRFSIGRKTDP